MTDIVEEKFNLLNCIREGIITEEQYRTICTFKDEKRVIIVGNNKEKMNRIIKGLAYETKNFLEKVEYTSFLGGIGIVFSDFELQACATKLRRYFIYEDICNDSLKKVLNYFWSSMNGICSYFLENTEDIIKNIKETLNVHERILAGIDMLIKIEDDRVTINKIEFENGKYILKEVENGR